jgi:hypothetical protein
MEQGKIRDLSDAVGELPPMTPEETQAAVQKLGDTLLYGGSSRYWTVQRVAWRGRRGGYAMARVHEKQRRAMKAMHAAYLRDAMAREDFARFNALLSG